MFRNDYNALSLNAINQLKLNFAKMEKRSHHTFYFEYKNMHQFDHQRSLTSITTIPPFWVEQGPHSIVGIL